jgi:DNA-binding beta-propeller fold protein YncE
MAHLFSLALGLLKPRPDKQNHTTPIQRASENKLLDLNILRVIRSYFYAPFYFTSQDVAVQHRIAFTGGVNGVELEKPTYICELLDGCIAVTELNQPIRIFRGDVLVQSIYNGIISCISGICVNSLDQLVVTDEKKDQIHIFNRDGSHVRSFGGLGSEDGKLKSPQGLCVNSIGQIIVAEYGNKRISVFDKDGKFVYKIDDNYSVNGALNVCVDGEDNIYVVNYDNHHILKFSKHGAFICKFGSHGNGPGQLSRPYGICVTRDGKYIVVTESDNDRMQILSGLDGSFVASYGSKGNDIDQFLFAAGCCITYDGRILVLDYYNRRVHEISKV